MEQRETITVDAEGYRQLVAAADRFVMLVETGRAPSTETYHALLSALNTLENYRPLNTNAEG